jgi:hypothetical protein
LAAEATRGVATEGRATTEVAPGVLATVAVCRGAREALGDAMVGAGGRAEGLGVGAVPAARVAAKGLEAVAAEAAASEAQVVALGSEEAEESVLELLRRRRVQAA